MRMPFTAISSAAVLALLTWHNAPLSAASKRFVDGHGQDYFPPEASVSTPECEYSWRPKALKNVPQLSDDQQQTIAENLRVTREPSLIGKVRTGKYPDAVRFVWWHASWTTVSIRIEMGPKKSRIIAKKASVFYNDYQQRMARTLTDTEVEQLRALLAETQLFDSRPDDCELVLDGTNWFFETAGSGGYDFVERNSPSQDKPAFIVGKFLIGLTGWKNSPLNYEIENARANDAENE